MLTGIYGNPENIYLVCGGKKNTQNPQILNVKPLNNIRVSSGKGVFSMLLAFKALKKGIPVYSNFHLKTDGLLKEYAQNWHYLTIDGLYEVEQQGYDNVKIFVDEAVTWIESRVSAHDDTNLYIDYILAQSRKNSEDWVMISQLKSMLDKRFRLMSNCEIWCADRRLRNNEGGNCTDDFHYMITNKIRAKPLTLTYKKVLKLGLFDMYNTKEKIMSPKFETLQFKMNEGNREKLNAVIDEYVKKVLENLPYEFKNITQYQVKDTMLRLNLPLDYVPYVYARIKSKK